MLILLVVLSGALLATAIFQRDRALEQAYQDAQERAKLYTGTVLRSSLAGADLTAPLEGEDRRALLAEVQGFVVLTDAAVARVRVWSLDGTLLFSTDPSDSPGESVEDPVVGIAADGEVRSRLTVEELSPSIVEAQTEATPLFQTFAPVRGQDATEVVGVAEVEQFASELEARADDPWWTVQMAASAVTASLALLALVAVVHGMRRPRVAQAAEADERPRRWRRRKDTGLEGDAVALRDRLDRATARAREAEEAAQSFAGQLQQVSSRLEAIEQQSPDERVKELKEALRRSEAERALLRSGRPETVLEAEVRELRRELREAQSLAKAAEALVAGGGDVSAVREQLSTAARQVEEAVHRAKLADARADAAEDRARSAGDMATAAEQRIDLFETKLHEIAASGIAAAEGGASSETQRLLAEARARADDMERRAREAEARLAATSTDGPSEEVLRALEDRIRAAEARSTQTHAMVRAFEEEQAEGSSVLRHRLGLTKAGRKQAAAPSLEPGSEPDVDLRSAIARSLRAPLTRATGLTLTLQNLVDSGEGKNLVRQLSASLRRLDRVAADLHEIHRIADGTLPLDRRRVDLAALVTTTVEEADRLEDRLVRVDADTVHARVDPARARQIVEGMLDAARERTRSGAAMVVRVRDLDAGARVSVEDDNRTPAALGPEMTLAIRLAELHGTEIVPDGSSFRVLFQKDERL
jgi:hypothetical protein